MNEEELRKEAERSMKEFDLAWEEFFKNKPEPKNDSGTRKQMEEFMLWYNNERKQSDTGKTPAQMYKEIYGTNAEENRKIDFVWDEDYKEPNEMMAEADYLISKHKYKEALKILDYVQKIIGDEEEVLLMKAEVLNNLGRFEEAERFLKKIGKNSDYKAYASFYRSQRYMFEGNFVRALKYMKEAYEGEPENFDFIIGIANHLYLYNDKYYKEYLEKAGKIDKKRTEKFLKKFWLEPEEIIKEPLIVAILDCSNELIMKNELKEAYENLSFLMIYEHLLDKEIIKVIRGLKIECLIIMKDYDKSLKEIEELIKVDLKNPHAYFYKAHLYYENLKLNEALNEIDKCLEIAEKAIPHPDFYMMKSMILKKLDADEYLYYENKAKELMKAQGPLREAFEDFFGKDKRKDN